MLCGEVILVQNCVVCVQNILTSAHNMEQVDHRVRTIPNKTDPFQGLQ